jgi:hypothetical protein
MTIPCRFDRRHGKGAFLRLCAMLADPALAYQQIGDEFGFTKQYIARLAKQLGIDGNQRRRQRERLRMLRREPRVIKIDYPVGIQAVIDKIRRRGIPVTPYIFPAQPSAPYLARRSQTMVLVNGRLCTIQFRKSRKMTPNGREYVRFDTTVRIKGAEFALWAMRSGRVQSKCTSFHELICEISRLSICRWKGIMSIVLGSPAKTGAAMSERGICYAERFTHDDRRCYPEPAVANQ